jgi:nucleoporin NUP82
MEVAAACFGGRGSGGWSPMTLWVAMREGDVYALCPLLPEKWAPPPTLIPSLSISIVAKVANLEDDFDASEQEKLLAQQQLAWMSDLDNQDPIIVEGLHGDPAVDIYTRPSKPGRVPKLQGPFDFELGPDEMEDDLDDMLTDIYVIGAKIDSDELMLGEEEDLIVDDVDQEGLSAGVVCLLSSSGRITVCLDLDGVEAQWLPRTKAKNRKFFEVADPQSLLTFQVIETLKGPEVYEKGWPMFSHDVSSRYSFFVTHSSGITFVSLSSWVFRLETELQGESGAGVDFRIDLLVNGQNSVRERLLTQKLPTEGQEVPLAACTAILDPDLGYFLLTATSNRPIALTLEDPDIDIEPRHIRSRSPTYDSEPQPQPLLLCAPRPVYQPSETLGKGSKLPEWHAKARRSQLKRIMGEPVRLSPATLEVFTEAHKILAQETHNLSTAVAELFRRCERLQSDLRDQIARAAEVAARVESVVGDADSGDEDANRTGGNDAIERRIENAQARQKDLIERLEAVRRKAGRGRGGALELSDKERIWIEEVSSLSDAVLPPGKKSKTIVSKTAHPSERFDQLQSLYNDLITRVKTLEASATAEGEVGSEIGSPGSVRVPSRVRRQKIKQVTELLDRETALIEGAKGRLERLSLV